VSTEEETDADAGKRLDALMKEKIIIDGSVLYLDSPGGNLTGALELGRTIRKHHLTTEVATEAFTITAHAGEDESITFSEPSQNWSDKQWESEDCLKTRIPCATLYFFSSTRA